MTCNVCGKTLEQSYRVIPADRFAQAGRIRNLYSCPGRCHGLALGDPPGRYDKAIPGNPQEARRGRRR